MAWLLLLGGTLPAQHQERDHRRDVTRAVAHLLECAYVYFDQGRPDRLEKIAEGILQIDPDYPVGRELKEDAGRLRANPAVRETVSAKVEEWKKETDADDEAVIPLPGKLGIPSLEAWKEMKGRIILLTEPDDPGDVSINQVLGKLERMRVDLTFERASLEELIAVIRDFTGLDFILDAAVVGRVDLEKKIEVKAKDAILKDFLNQVLPQYGLAYAVTEGEVVLLTVPTRLGLVLELQDLRPIFQRLWGPDVRFAPLAATAPGCALFMLEGDDGPGHPSELLEFIRARVAPGTWDQDRTMEVTPNLQLLVNHVPAAHAELRQLLERLKAFDPEEWEERRRTHLAEFLQGPIFGPVARAWRAKVQELVDRFGDLDLPVRATAEAELIRLGRSARPFVEPCVREGLAEAENGGDFEGAGRCRAVLEGIGPSGLTDTLGFWHAMTRP